VLLLILAFPGSLYANDLSSVPQNLIARHNQVLSIVVSDRIPSRVIAQHGDRGLVLMDADARLRAAAALVGNPAIEKPAESTRVPLRMIVITASPLLEV
jgi:hypothetical protein